MRPLACALVLLLTSCGGDESVDRQGAGELAGFVLREDEAPPGLELEARNRIESLRDVLPPTAAAPQLPPLPTELRRAFEDGYEAAYAGGSDEGLSSGVSSVLRFSDQGNAGLFLDYLRDAQSAPLSPRAPGSIELVEAPTLGDEGYAWHSLAPGGETSGCSWRRGDLVLTLTLSGTVGSAPSAATLELGRSIDSRL
jgi:hypothetical protein